MHMERVLGSWDIVLSMTACLEFFVPFYTCFLSGCPRRLITMHADVCMYIHHSTPFVIQTVHYSYSYKGSSISQDTKIRFVILMVNLLISSSQRRRLDSRRSVAKFHLGLVASLSPKDPLCLPHAFVAPRLVLSFVPAPPAFLLPWPSGSRPAVLFVLAAQQQQQQV